MPELKVLLIQPPTPLLSISLDHLYLDEPLALEYLAADIAPICDVRVLDMRLDRNLAKHISMFQPDVIGLTGYTVHVPTIMSICEKVKQLNSQIITIVGGHHATVAPEDFSHPVIDIVVIGEGIPTLRELLEKVASSQSYQDIAGIAFKIDGRQVKSPSRAIANLDDHPLPDRSVTSQYQKHYHDYCMKPTALVRTSKGCPNQCNFCSQWKLTGRRYLKRSIDSIISELHQIEAESIYFADDESFIDPKRMGRLAEAIRIAGIKKNYRAVIRSDTIVNNPTLMKEWQSIGLESVAVGIEFHSQRDLDYINKGTTAKTNEQAIDILEAMNIDLSPLLIVKPDFAKSDFEELAAYARRLKFDSRIQFSVLTPLKGTDLYEETKEQLLDVSPEFFDCVHTVLPTKLPLKEFYSQYAQLYQACSPWAAAFGTMKTVPFWRIATTIWHNYRLLSRVRNLYKDY